jgi:hypothetical protein
MDLNDFSADLISSFPISWFKLVYPRNKKKGNEREPNLSHMSGFGNALHILVAYFYD